MNYDGYRDAHNEIVVRSNCRKFIILYTGKFVNDRVVGELYEFSKMNTEM